MPGRAGGGMGMCTFGMEWYIILNYNNYSRHGKKLNTKNFVINGDILTLAEHHYEVKVI